MAYEFNMKDIERNFGTVDEVEYTGKDSEFMEPKYMQILRLTRSGVGFDISMTSTGVALWYNNELKFTVIDVSKVVDEDASNKEKEECMRSALAEALTSLVEGKDFDIFSVEGVYGGENFKVFHALATLNTVPDDLIRNNIAKCDSFIRYDNQEWKFLLRQLHKVPHAPTPKEEIRKIMEYLEFPIERLSRFNTEGKSDRDQDLLDALGILLASIIEKYMDVKRETKVSLKDMKLWYCESIDEYEACYNDGEEYIVVDIASNFKANLEKCVRETKGQKTIVVETTTDVLGKFALEYNIPLNMDSVCIIATPKKRRKKNRVIIID